jgi:hypothetical protein
MIKNSDVDFLLNRVAEELVFADDCADASAAHVHRQMAALYAGRLTELRQQGHMVAVVPFIANN